MLLTFIEISALLRVWTVQKSFIVDGTHLVLASDKLVLQKKTIGTYINRNKAQIMDVLKLFVANDTRYRE